MSFTSFSLLIMNQAIPSTAKERQLNEAFLPSARVSAIDMRVNESRGCIEAADSSAYLDAQKTINLFLSSAKAPEDIKSAFRG